MHRPIVDLLHRGGVIVYAAPDTTVHEAVEKMAFHNVGSILIMEHHRRLVGICTERDVTRRVVLMGIDATTTPISEVMSRNPVLVKPRTPRGEVLNLMRKRHIRHIPIVDEDRVLGVISLRDLLRFENYAKDREIEHLKTYVTRQTYPA